MGVAGVSGCWAAGDLILLQNSGKTWRRWNLWGSLVQEFLSKDFTCELHQKRSNLRGVSENESHTHTTTCHYRISTVLWTLFKMSLQLSLWMNMQHRQVFCLSNSSICFLKAWCVTSSHLVVRKHIENNVNPCFLMSHLISHLSSISCNVRVKPSKPRADPRSRLKCSLLANEKTTVIYFEWLYVTKNIHMYFVFYFMPLHTL